MGRVGDRGAGLTDAAPGSGPVASVEPRADRLSLVEARLLRWLLSSSLAHRSGAIAAWRSHGDGTLAFEYPEITGYFLTLATFAGRATEPVVSRAGDWLAARVEAGDYAARPDSPTVYNFDLAIASSGLVNVGVATGSERHVSAGLRLATHVRDRILRLGHLPAIDRASSPAPVPHKWSTGGRAHLLKAVQCLCLAAEQGVERMKEAAGLQAAAARPRLDLGGDDFADGDSGPNLHAVCYALEGSWLWRAAAGDSSLAEGAAAVLRRLREAELPSGGFPAGLGRNRSVEQADVSAQVARLELLFGVADGRTLRTLRRLADTALPSGDGVAIPYRPDAAVLDESSWGSMFAWQALRLAQTGDPLDWRLLV